MFTTLGSSNHVPEEREAFDYYATDPKAVEMLLELEQFAPVIWEPACGEGHISKVLQAHGYEVISTDIVYRGFGDPEPLDFLTETLDGFEGDMITCDEGTLEWVKKSELERLNLWEGDKIFFKLLKEEHPFFSLKLKYRGDVLTEAVLDGKRLKTENQG